MFAVGFVVGVYGLENWYGVEEELNYGWPAHSSYTTSRGRFNASDDAH
jgi:hypothetical protein